MTNEAWKKAILEELSNAGELGRESAEYIRQHKVRLRFKRYSKSTGARWFLFKQISLNKRYYSPDSKLDEPKILSLLVHEVHHLKQGILIALSVYGELDAWQVEYRFYKETSSKKLAPTLEEMLALPLNYDRDNLQRAAKLMRGYAGKGYRIDLYPIYPLLREIRYWLGGGK